MRLSIRHVVVLLLALAIPSVARAQETIEYYGTDAIGSIRIVFAPTGQVLGRQDYGPFGNQLLAVPQLPAERFAGQTTDDESQQANFHARILQARSGRFTRPDPIQGDVFVPQRWNRYAYALNSPADTTDAFGLDPCSPGVNSCVTSVPACTAFYCGTGGVGAQSHSGEIWVDFWPNNRWNLIGYGSNHPGPYSGLGSGTGSGTSTSTTTTDTSSEGTSTTDGSSVGANNGASIRDAPLTPLPWYKNSCIMSALGDGALHVGIDAIGLIPEAGGIARVIGHQAGYVGVVADRAGTRVIHGVGAAANGEQGLAGLSDTSTEGVVSTGLTVAGFIPGLGTAVAAAAVGWDIFKTVKAIRQCP